MDGVLWTWQSDSDLSKKLGRNPSFVNTLKTKGFFYPEIIRQGLIDKVDNSGSCEVDGVLWTWKNDADLSKKLGKYISYVSGLKRRGFSYPEIIRQGLIDKVSTSGSCEVDGALWTWKSDSDLSRKLGRSIGYVASFKRRGFSYPEIIRQSSCSTSGSCEVDGVLWTWKSDADLSRKLGRSIGYVAVFKRAGLSYPEIIRQGLSDGSGSGNSTKDMSLFKKDDDGNN